MTKRLTVLALALSLAGCDSSPTVACAAIAQAGLDVSVINELNGQGICDASVTAVDGMYRESLRAERTGYATREVTNVSVTMGTGDCPHVQTASVVIRLTPLAVDRRPPN